MQSNYIIAICCRALSLSTYSAWQDLVGDSPWKKCGFIYVQSHPRRMNATKRHFLLFIHLLGELNVASNARMRDVGEIHTAQIRVLLLRWLGFSLKLLCYACSTAKEA